MDWGPCSMKILAANHINDSCLFRGRRYPLEEKIDNDVTYESCNVACFCNNRSNGAGFTCAVLDCPEWLGVPVEPGCYRRYEVNKCCSSGVNCPSEDKPIEECDVEGKKYKEGEKFFPKNTCMKCICPKNFNGKFDLPYCKRMSCGVQINHAEELHNRCAPVHLGFDDSLLLSRYLGLSLMHSIPNTYLTSPSDDIKQINEKVQSNAELTCRFGTKKRKFRRRI
ncbi:hypothetical protein NQ317_018669 [Molorchus minor]|uniref:VWFC domain-containing protein n=1 Tax=Molorchus minor TaxID=1323400 RepID=A0ABQ9IQT7_9CUCU|nr:hypothetical protein NQ317_018669 [Molorchus minor]